MLIKNIFMELRSRLRSCNVFITTGVDFSKNCNLKISIQSNCIVLNYYYDDDNSKLKRKDSLSSIESLSDCYSTEEENDEVTTVIPIGDFCKIIPNSMSCLKIDQSIVSFRILTEPKNGGNFYKELLSANSTENTKKASRLKINVKTDEGLKINCANCSNIISDNEVKFERILELPSANLDISEWFCHGHSHSHAHGDAPQNDLVLKPNNMDFLYHLTFFVVNSSMLSDKTNKFNVKRDVYHCDRCLAWLGLKNKDGTVKLFDSEVKINQNGIESTVFSHKHPSGDIRTDDFIYTIEYMTKEFNIGFQYTIMCKIVLECTISSSNKQYLLIWVMDKELQVLKNTELIENDKILLTSTSVMKILFKVEPSLNEEVEAWLSDPAVVSTDISKNMFVNGLEHLQNMSLKVPEAFRNTNGYCVSYLKV